MASASASPTAASCMDQAKGGTETDLNCGGAQCDPCATGQRCCRDDDCLGTSDGLIL